MSSIDIDSDRIMAVVAGGEVAGPPPRKVFAGRFELPAVCDGNRDPGEAFWGRFPRQRQLGGAVLSGGAQRRGVCGLPAGPSAGPSLLGTGDSSSKENHGGVLNTAGALDSTQQQ